MYMKKLVKNLLAACMCLSMAFTAVPAVNSGESGAGIFNAQTVQAAKTGLYHEENGWNYYEDGEWSNATTLGSFKTTPLPFSYTSIVAVPKSIPNSVPVFQNHTFIHSHI